MTCWKRLRRRRRIRPTGRTSAWEWRALRLFQRLRCSQQQGCGRAAPEVELFSTDPEPDENASDDSDDCRNHDVREVVTSQEEPGPGDCETQCHCRKTASPRAQQQRHGKSYNGSHVPGGKRIEVVVSD